MQAYKQLKATLTQLQRFKDKESSVQDLKRNLNTLTNIKEANDRAENRSTLKCKRLLIIIFRNGHNMHAGPKNPPKTIGKS